jgi:hypothetical protein
MVLVLLMLCLGGPVMGLLEGYFGVPLKPILSVPVLLLIGIPIYETYFSSGAAVGPARAGGLGEGLTSSESGGAAVPFGSNGHGSGSNSPSANGSNVHFEEPVPSGVIAATAL